MKMTEENKDGEKIKTMLDLVALFDYLSIFGAAILWMMEERNAVIPPDYKKIFLDVFDRIISAQGAIMPKIRDSVPEDLNPWGSRVKECPFHIYYHKAYNRNVEAYVDWAVRREEEPCQPKMELVQAKLKKKI